MKNITITKTFHNEDDREIELTVTVSPGCPGKYDGPWEDCYEASPAEVEIDEVIWVDTKEDLTDEEISINIGDDDDIFVMLDEEYEG